jgi:RimJ/RimL family protein N-acetyltransferase
MTLPARVFRGDWHEFLFFDSDWILNGPEGAATLRAIIAGESIPVPPGLFRGHQRETVAFASATGRWSLHVEGRAELAVLAVRDPDVLAAIEPVVRRVGALPIEKALVAPNCMALAARRPKFLKSLLRAYGKGHAQALVARTKEHARVLYPLLRGTAVTDTLVWDGPDTREQFLATYATYSGLKSHRHYTILGDGEPVGSLSIRPGPQKKRGDIGYWVGIPHQRKGYATAAVGEALRFAFGCMGMEKVEASAFVGNVASLRVLTKCGFAEEGLVRKAVLKRGVWLDECVFGITREDWVRPG